MFLTPKDRQTIRLVLKGMNNREIGQLMGMCEQAVKNRMNKVFKKAGAANRVDLVVETHAHPGWIGAEKCKACGQMKPRIEHEKSRNAPRELETVT